MRSRGATAAAARLASSAGAEYLSRSVTGWPEVPVARVADVSRACRGRARAGIRSGLGTWWRGGAARGVRRGCLGEVCEEGGAGGAGDGGGVLGGGGGGGGQAIFSIFLSFFSML